MDYIFWWIYVEGNRPRIFRGLCPSRKPRGRMVREMVAMIARIRAPFEYIDVHEIIALIRAFGDRFGFLMGGTRDNDVAFSARGATPTRKGFIAKFHEKANRFRAHGDVKIAGAIAPGRFRGTAGDRRRKGFFRTLQFFLPGRGGDTTRGLIDGHTYRTAEAEAFGMNRGRVIDTGRAHGDGDRRADHGFLLGHGLSISLAVVLTLLYGLGTLMSSIFLGDIKHKGTNEKNIVYVLLK